MSDAMGKKMNQSEVGGTSLPDLKTEVRGNDREQLDYLRRAVAYAKGDDLERATAHFRGLTAAQMQEQHGQSGCTRQEILDNYRTLRIQHDQAAALLETLIAIHERTIHPNLAGCSHSTPTSDQAHITELETKLRLARQLLWREGDEGPIEALQLKGELKP